MRLLRLVLLIATIAAAGATSARAADGVRYGQQGRWITDAEGRVTVLRGVNMVNKLQESGYAPSAIGFGDDDAAFLARNGFDVVRLGVIWKGLEPRPGQYDDAYLARIERTYRTLRRHGIAVLLDFHQDQYNERFQGEGAPDWAVLGQAAAETPEPQAGFPYNYVLQDAVNHAFDAFWANTVVPGTGRGVQDLYADAWMHVAERFKHKPGIVGYNLLNEPWQGTSLQRALQQGCATGPDSCGIRAFEAGTLTAFHRRVVAAIREVDKRTPVWAAPTLAADFGAVSGNGRLQGPSGFAFNAYCGQLNPGIAAVIPYVKDKSCRFTAGLSFKNAEAVSERNDQALLLTEFGAGDELSDFSDYVEAADAHMVSWTYWSYWNTDVADRNRAVEGLINDPSKPPTGSNVKTDKLALLARPRPAVVAGTPLGWRWKADRRTFRLRYSAGRAGGGRAFAPGSVTRVTVPRVQFSGGYRTRVSGARVVSRPGARVLRVALCPRQHKAVEVTVKPGRTAARARRCG